MLFLVTLDEIPSEYMRARKFLAHLAQSVGEQLGWKHVKILRSEEPFHLPVSRITYHTPEMVSGIYDFEYRAPFFHSDGWYFSDEYGACLVSFGNGATYLRNGFPLIVGTLTMVVGAARPAARRRKKSISLRDPIDIIRQEHYQRGVLLFALPDGSLALSDEHPFSDRVQIFLFDTLSTNASTTDYCFSGITPDKQPAKWYEWIYRASFVPQLANVIRDCVIAATEGDHVPVRPTFTVLSSIQD